MTPPATWIDPVHRLEGRTEEDLLWFQRRSFLQAASSWVALGGWQAAQAQERSNIIDLKGDALVNGQQLSRQQAVQTGDTVQTGPDSNLVFVIGNASFQVRPNSHVVVERGTSLLTVSILRLLTGGVLSVWGKGASRQIVTPTLTVGIRGTGVYTEVFPERDNRTYFCNCYGTVDLVSGTSKVQSEANYHQAFWTEPEPVNGAYLSPARLLNHTDEEVEYLAALVQQRTRWQETGVRGNKNPRGGVMRDLY
jgi:hypothetical protein